LFGDASKVDELDSDWDENETFNAKSIEHRNIQREITRWKTSLGPKIFKKVFTAFCTLAKNGEELDRKGEAGIFLTENSIMKNLVKQFGYKSEFLAKRFYYLMTGGQLGQRVTFPDFMSYLRPLLF
jgi:hypothetical protein